MIEIAETFVVSLAIDWERREHITEHFESLGLRNFSFVDAVTPSDLRVRDLYDLGQVATYPPCFRCGHVRCDCFNNILIPAQVANWISFRKIWAMLPPDPDLYFMICEDDVAFHMGGMSLLNDFLSQFTPEREQVLIRMAQSGLEPYQTLDADRVTTRWGPVMSNAAYILNGALAARLLREPLNIAQTSDNWLHGEMGAKPDIHAVTLDPLLATDLSYSAEHARFRSRIHPKGVDDADLEKQQKHVKHVDSPEEYEAAKKTWFKKENLS